MMAALVVSENEIDIEETKKQLKSAPRYNDEKFMDTVSTKNEEVYGVEDKTVVVVDTGAKNAIFKKSSKFRF